jgi:hypothetical protein
MSSTRDTKGRFAPKPFEELSPSYGRRLISALARGFTRSEARGHRTAAPPAWKSATVAASPKYEKALEVLRRTRKGESFTRASRAVGIQPDTVRRYAGSAFERDQRGRWRARSSDRLFRKMRLLDARGLTWVEPANSTEARKLAEYWNAVEHFIVTGQHRQLRRFQRMRLRTRQKTSLSFLTDPQLLMHLGHAGELSFEDLYQH